MKKSTKQLSSISVLPETIEGIARYPEGRYFSTKLDNLVNAFWKGKNELVIYETDDQRNKGEPRLLNSNAVRVWGWSAHLKGFDSDNQFKKEIQEIQKSIKEKSCSVPKVMDEVIKKLAAKDFLVQRIEDTENDLKEIWISIQANNDCGNCQVLKRIKDIIAEVK